MIGAIAGDIIGHRFEFSNIETTEFDLFNQESTFTDDTVLTVATADALMTDKNYLQKYQKYFDDYPGRGWGGGFFAKASCGCLGPYGSYGNGSAMRVSPVGWYCDTVTHVMREAYSTAAVTHDHPEGVKGAQAIALATYMARTGFDKMEIAYSIKTRFDYNISKPYTAYGREFDETCQGTVPKAIAIFLGTRSYEEAIRESIAQGGDVDTIACIVGGIAQAFYGMPDKDIVKNVYLRLTPQLREVITDFTKSYVDGNFVPPLIETEEIGLEIEKREV